MKRLFIAMMFLALLAAPAGAAEMSQAPTDLASMQALAQEGDANAQLNLGNYYATPHNAAPDLDSAAIWYRKAAEQGNAEAQYRLGDFYYNGLGGLKQNYEAAYFWFCLSAKAGPKAFAIDRDETAGHLTPAQLAAVARLLKTWKPTPASH